MDKKDKVANMTQNYLDNCQTDSNLRLKSSAFTRKRKLTEKRMLLILLQRLVCSLQLGMDRFFEYIAEESVSKQAFSKARANLNPEYVRKFADGIAEIHARDSDAPAYCGMRLIAIDGTGIALENRAELKKAFGCSGSKRDAATALGPMAFGPLDHAIYDCQIAPYATDERDLAKLHMIRRWESGLVNSLLPFDRWYPSAAFLDYTRNAGFSFVTNRTIAYLRNRFFLILLEQDPDLRRALFVRLSRDIAAYPVSIRPDRSPAQNIPRSKHFFMAKKSVLP